MRIPERPLSIPERLPSPAVHHARGGCAAYCQARTLRRQLQSVHGRTVALARRAALPVPPPPRLGWRRERLRVQLSHQARVLGRYRVQARRPLRLRLERFEAWVCIHRHEAAWNDRGDPYWGGLQMDRGFMRAYGARHDQRATTAASPTPGRPPSRSSSPSAPTRRADSRPGRRPRAAAASAETRGV